jgi:uncharacterized protein (TIGR03437 family)
VPANALLSISTSSLTFSQVALGNPPPAQTLSVTTSPNTTYSVSANTAIGSGWLTVSPSGTMIGSQTFTVSGNQSGFGTFGAYTGDLTFVSGNVTQHVPVTLNIVRPLGPQRITTVGNAASFADGAIAPGEIVSIVGTSLGPSNPLGPVLDSSGKVGKLLGGVSVNFNGYLAPLTYVSSTQINCVVPYEIAGSSVAGVQVFYLNQTSPVFSLRVADTMPGIFTLNGSGTGQVAALNSSGGFNGPANPALAGSLFTFFVTGEGQTVPASTTGAVTIANTSLDGPLTPQPRAAVNVSIGSKPSRITFFGEAPGQVSGAMQLNVEVPADVAAGNEPVIVSVGSAQSLSGVSVSVQ